MLFLIGIYWELCTYYVTCDLFLNVSLITNQLDVHYINPLCPVITYSESASQQQILF